MIAVGVEQDVKVSEDLNAELKEGRKQIYGDSVGDSLSIKGRDHSCVSGTYVTLTDTETERVSTGGAQCTLGYSDYDVIFIND
jgi:hypothetical protein